MTPVSHFPKRPPPPIDRLIRMHEVKQIVGLSRSTIYAKITTGEFPQPRRLTTATVGWQLSELMAWIDSRPNANGKPR